MKGPLLCWLGGIGPPYTPTLLYPTLHRRLPLPFLQLWTLLAILYYGSESGLGSQQKELGRRQEVGPRCLLTISNSTGRPCHQGPPLFVYFSIIIYGCSKCGEYPTQACGPLSKEVGQTQFELGRLTICNPVVKPTM